jgi:hypothetical protein
LAGWKRIDVKASEENATRRTHALLLALGGGGDVLAAAMFAEILKARGLSPVLVSVAWERFVKDPLPGPRSLSELSHVKLFGKHLARASKHTAFPNGALTNQATLAGRVGIENYILDPHQGVVGLKKGLKELRKLFEISEAWGIDVGGDLLAERSSPHVRSPLADAMLLSALVGEFPDAKAAVFGMGVDGELPRRVWTSMIARHLRRELVLEVTTLPMSGVRMVSQLLDDRLVDTEATAMIVRAYQGLHGRYLVRDAGSIISVDHTTLCGFTYRANDVATKINELAVKVAGSETLQSASSIIEEHGYQSEWRYETEKVKRLQGSYPSVRPDELRPRVQELLAEISHKKPVIHFVAERYLAESLKVAIGSIREVLEELATEKIVSIHRPFVKLQRRNLFQRVGE